MRQIQSLFSQDFKCLIAQNNIFTQKCINRIQSLLLRFGWPKFKQLVASYHGVPGRVGPNLRF